MATEQDAAAPTLAVESRPDNDPSESRKRMRPEDRRNAVLDAALRVFADAGFRRASLKEVGDEAGVTKGCVYHYFNSKEELLLALMRERTQSAAKACLAESQNKSRNEALALMVKSLWRKYERDGQLELTSVALTELPHAPEVARVLFDEVAVPNRAYLRDVLNRMNTTSADVSTRDDAPARSSADNELAAILVPFMVMGAALGFRMYADIDPVRRDSADIEAGLLRILERGV